MCGHNENDLNPFAAEVKLTAPLMVTSEALDALSEIRGKRMALGYVGSLVTTPIAWEYPTHDGFHDSKVTLHWPSHQSHAD